MINIDRSAAASFHMHLIWAVRAFGVCIRLKIHYAARYGVACQVAMQWARSASTRSYYSCPNEPPIEARWATRRLREAR